MAEMIATRTLLGGRYELLTAIGSGVSADVYIAMDRVLSRRVALKRLRPALSDDDKFLNLFKSEAQISAQLNHQHILAIYDWGQDDGVYLVTELLRGGTLRSVLQEQGTIDAAQAVSVGLQAASGLEAAHAQDLVHRDIKPANLLFDQAGRLRIADFGVARAVAESSWTELTGTFVGTVRYAAPEQMKRRSGDQPVDSRSDIYSLGLCLAEMVTGQVPLSGQDAFETIALRQESDVSIELHQSEKFAALINSCCAVDPASRPTATECIAALEKIVVELEPPSPLQLVELNIDEQYLAEIEAQDRTEVDLELVDKDLISDVYVVPGRFEEIREGLFGFVEDNLRRLLFAAASIIGMGLCLWLFIGSLSEETERVGSLSLILPQAMEVPDVEGLPEAQAIEILSELGWDVEVSRQRQNDTVIGEVLTQDVESGQLLKSSEVVNLTVSDGQELGLVPNVVGRSVAEAEALVASAGLSLGERIVVFDNNTAKGIVTAVLYDGEDISSETVNLENGSVVQLRVSDGAEPIEIPNVYGLSPGSAAEVLEELGFETTVERIFTAALSEGLAVGSDPRAETSAAPGSTITIKVSKGQQPVVLPDVVGRTGDAARSALENLGLKVNQTGGASSNNVIQMSPSSGTTVKAGDTVTILTGL